MDLTAKRQKTLETELQKELLNLKHDLQQQGDGHPTDVTFSLNEQVHRMHRAEALRSINHVAQAKPLVYQHNRLKTARLLHHQRDYADANLPALAFQVKSCY